jgi:hypothetical protein
MSAVLLQQSREGHMEEIIRSLTGKKIDVNCGHSSMFRGENLGFANGVLTVKDETGKTVFIDATKIVAVIEVSEASGRPGFIG